MSTVERALIVGVIAGLWVMSSLLAFVLLCQATS